VALARLSKITFDNEKTNPFVLILLRHINLAAAIVLKDKKIPVEINLTSNNYLLHQHDQSQDVLSLKYSAKIFLATDDDGVWPLNGSKETDDFIGLHGEYMKAIKERLITENEMSIMMQNASEFSFKILSNHVEKRIDRPTSDFPSSAVIFDPAYLFQFQNNSESHFLSFQNNFPWLLQKKLSRLSTSTKKL
jgi:hypothetical protein